MKLIGKGAKIYPKSVQHKVGIISYHLLPFSEPGLATYFAAAVGSSEALTGGLNMLEADMMEGGSLKGTTRAAICTLRN